MAPPEHPFPVSELENHVHSYSHIYKEKSRKLPRDFDLKRDCELYEIVQYSCTTLEQQYEQARTNQGRTQVECFPFVRLFRRCGKGDKMFHVETTAWEGEHAWKPPTIVKSNANVSNETSPVKNEGPFANYGSYFWSNK